MKGVGLNSIAEVFEKPEPVRVIFGVDNKARGNREPFPSTLVAVRRIPILSVTQHRENLDIASSETNERVTIVEADGRGNVTDENTAEFIL